jgi:hypothetical protein
VRFGDVWALAPCYSRGCCHSHPPGVADAGRGRRSFTAVAHAIAVLMRPESADSPASYGAIRRKSPGHRACCATFRVRMPGRRGFFATFGPKNPELPAFRAGLRACSPRRSGFLREPCRKKREAPGFGANLVAKSAEPRALSPDGPGFSREGSRSKPGARISPLPALPAGCRRRTCARSGVLLWMLAERRQGQIERTLVNR